MYQRISDNRIKEVHHTCYLSKNEKKKHEKRKHLEVEKTKV